MVNPILFKTHIDKLSYLKTFYLEVPASIVNDIGEIGKQRLVCEVNEQITFQCGLMALSEGKAYISINTKRMKELQVKVGEFVRVRLTKDDSEYGVDMPEEIIELFKQDAEAKYRFDLLKPGMQRYILNYVNTAKSPKLRLHNAFMLTTNLKNLPKGKETFKDILGK